MVMAVVVGLSGQLVDFSFSDGVDREVHPVAASSSAPRSTLKPSVMGAARGGRNTVDGRADLVEVEAGTIVELLRAITLNYHFRDRFPPAQHGRGKLALTFGHRAAGLDEREADAGRRNRFLLQDRDQ